MNVMPKPKKEKDTHTHTHKLTLNIVQIVEFIQHTILL